MPTGVAGVLLICSVIVATIVHGKSIPRFDGSPDNFNSPRYSAQHDTIIGFNDQNRGIPYPVNNINSLSSSQSGFRPIHWNTHSIPSPVYPPMFDYRPFPVRSFPIRPDSRIPPAPSSGVPFYYNVCHHGGYLNAGASTFGRPVYHPVSFYNNPTPYRISLQPPITSYAPHPLIYSGGGPVINSNSATSIKNEPNLPHSTKPPALAAFDVSLSGVCPPGSKRDFYNKCRKEVPDPSQSTLLTNRGDCPINYVKDTTGRCRKIVDLFG